jgi:hypothetical protein
MHCLTNGIEVTEEFLSKEERASLKSSIYNTIPRDEGKSYIFAIIGPTSQIDRLTKTCPGVKLYLEKVLCKHSNYFYFSVNYFTTNVYPPSEPHVNEAIPAALNESGLCDIANRYAIAEYVNTYYLEVPRDIQNNFLTFNVNGEHHMVVPKTNLRVRFDGNYEHWASEFRYDTSKSVARCCLVTDEVQMGWKDYLAARKVQYVDHFVEFDNNNITDLELNPSDENT